MRMRYRGYDIRALHSSFGWFASWVDAAGERHATGNFDARDSALESARDQVDDALLLTAPRD